MNKPINNLIQKDMSRKEFLTTMGFGVVSIFGFSTIVQLLTGKSFNPLSGSVQQHQTAQSNGYGSSPYGK